MSRKVRIDRIKLYNVIVGCGFCKRIKPEYAQAATELKGEAVSINLSASGNLYVYRSFTCKVKYTREQ